MNIPHEINLDAVRELLKHWGRWCHAILENGLSFPKTSLIGKLVETKGELIYSTNKTLAPENVKAEYIDNLMNQLAEINFKKARVLYIHYCFDKSQALKISISGVSKATYFRYLRDAESWIYRQIEII